MGSVNSGDGPTKSHNTPRNSVMVLGGGVSGLGVARALVDRGLQVLVLERNRLGGATSNNSHHIIHGGFRYLKSLDLLRTLESIRSLSELSRRYPQCVRPLPCLMALGESLGEHPLLAKLGAQLYNLLSGGRVKPAEVVSGLGVELSSAFSKLSEAGSLLSWWDGLLVDHQRLVKLIAEEIRLGGGEIEEEEQVLEIAKAEGGFVVTSRKGGRMLERFASVVISTLGPWDRDLKTVGFSAPGGVVPDWCRAFNVVLKQLIEPRFAIGIKTSQQERVMRASAMQASAENQAELSTTGRLFFFVPRSERRTAIGTGYLPIVGGRPEARVTDAEIQSFLNQASSLVQGASFSLKDVDRVEVGVLPVKGWSGEEALLFGREQIWLKTFNDGPTSSFVRVLSTKYTTFLEQGQRVVRRLPSS